MRRKLATILVGFFFVFLSDVRGLRAALKTRIAATQNNCCGSCGVRFGKGVPREIHHKNHNRSDHRVENLVALCSNCHQAHRTLRFFLWIYYCLIVSATP